MFDGALVSVPDMPWSYLPTLFALQLPELMIAHARRRRRSPRFTSLSRPGHAGRTSEEPSCPDADARGDACRW